MGVRCCRICKAHAVLGVIIPPWSSLRPPAIVQQCLHHHRNRCVNDVKIALKAFLGENSTRLLAYPLTNKHNPHPLAYGTPYLLSTTRTLVTKTMSTPAQELKPMNEEKEEIPISTPSPPPPSALGTVLLQARQDLWSAQPRFLAVFLDPLREFLLDPTLAISSILLPALFAPKLDALLAKLVSHTYLVAVHCLYSQHHTRYHQDSTAYDGVRDAAKNSLRHGSTGQQVRFQVLLKPPSDWGSAFQGAVSFAVSTVGDILGLFANPQKMRSWIDAMSQFNGFLEASGVGAELQEVRIGD